MAAADDFLRCLTVYPPRFHRHVQVRLEDESTLRATLCLVAAGFVVGNDFLVRGDMESRLISAPASLAVFATFMAGSVSHHMNSCQVLHRKGLLSQLDHSIHSLCWWRLLCRRARLSFFWTGLMTPQLSSFGSDADEDTNYTFVLLSPDGSWMEVFGGQFLSAAASQDDITTIIFRV